MKLNFEDLIDMFAVAMPTNRVCDYIREEYLNLKEMRNRTNHDLEIRLAQLENDPSTKVFAMEFSDGDFRVNKYDQGYGPLKSDDGTYDVVANHGVFKIKNGDYLVLHQRFGTDSSRIYVVNHTSFRSAYRMSYNF